MLTLPDVPRFPTKARARGIPLPSPPKRASPQSNTLHAALQQCCPIHSELRGKFQHRVGHAQRRSDLVAQLIGIAFPGAVREGLSQDSHSKIAYIKVASRGFATPWLAR